MLPVGTSFCNIIPGGTVRVLRGGACVSGTLSSRVSISSHLSASRHTQWLELIYEGTGRPVTRSQVTYLQPFRDGHHHCLQPFKYGHHHCLQPFKDGHELMYKLNSLLLLFANRLLDSLVYLCGS